MITEILILVRTPFSKRDYEFYGVEILRRKFRVSVLDCTSLLRPDVWRKYSDTAYQCPEYTLVLDWNTLICHLNSMTNAVVIDYLGACPGSREIREEIKKRNILRAVAHNGLVPGVDVMSVNRFQKIRNIIFANTPVSIIKKAYRSFKRRLNPEPAPEIVLLSGLASLNDIRTQGAVHKIQAHSFDYDLYLKHNIGEGADAVPYAVFLDVDLVFHSDYDHSQNSSPVTEESYYNALNAFWEKFEQDTGIPVIVAAHPQSRYDLRPQLLRGRSAIVGKTAQLVRDSTVVLSHASTSVSYAVLWRKPLVFLTTNELEHSNSRMHQLIVTRSSLLGAPLINMDEITGIHFDLKTLLLLDEKAYSVHSSEYIKLPGTPNLPAWQIFSDYLCQLP